MFLRVFRSRPDNRKSSRKRPILTAIIIAIQRAMQRKDYPLEVVRQGRTHKFIECPLCLHGIIWSNGDKHVKCISCQAIFEIEGERMKIYKEPFKIVKGTKTDGQYFSGDQRDMGEHTIFSEEAKNILDYY